MTALMAAGALGLDISKLVFERQQVRAAVDAAAQIGAARLTPNPFAAGEAAKLVKDIKDAVAANYGSSTYGPGLPAADVVVGGVTISRVSVEFYCVVRNTSGTSEPASPDAAQIPSTCSPNPAPVNYTNTKCSATSCAIPCYPLTEPTAVCNAVKVTGTKQVQFILAPVIGIDHGTALASTVSCQGSCGGDAPPNPLNVVVMADRTPSMFKEASASTGGGDTDLNGLKGGMLSMLKVMNTDQQYVAFGAIQKSVPKVSAGNLTTPPTKTDYTFENTTKKDCDRGGNNCTYTHTGNTFTGNWVPVAFSNNYIYKDAAGAAQWTTTADIYQSMANLTYSNITSTGYARTNFYQADGKVGNTHLAAALKGAARYLLNKVPNNIATLDAATKRPTIYGPAKNVIIFETDGSPVEIFSNASDDSDADLTLDDPDDIGNTGGARACANFKKVAAYAKAQGIIIITIGFGDASSSSTRCAGSTTDRVKDVLAAVASPIAGTAALANHDCTDTSINGGVFQENHDGDNYFCAATGDELKTVFTAALGNITGGTKFMAIDGVGD